MNEVHINVITGSNEYWIDLLQKYRYENNTYVSRLIIDFTRTDFLKPNHIVTLSCLIEEYHQNGIEISFIKGKYNVNQYLNNIRFYEYWLTGFDRNAFTNTKIDTALCLWHISKEMIYEYATQAQNYYQNHFFHGKDLHSLHITLSEVFNNIYDHSGSEIDGYVLTQYYPRLNKIVTSVCDFGIGIPTTINEMWQKNKGNILSDSDALRIALKKKVSSQSQPHNRGFGLDTLHSNVEKLKGELMILSNSALLSQKPNETVSYILNKRFQGTLLSIELDTNYLPELEEDVENEYDVW